MNKKYQKQQSSLSPKFEPMLFLGFLMDNVPHIVLQKIFDKSMKTMHTNHRNVFERMQSVNNPTFLINATDLPFCFLLDTNLDAPQLKIFEKEHLDLLTYDASITGSFSILMTMLEGESDGDALFFSRDIKVEGDTESIVALRNAIDSNNIDVFSEILHEILPEYISTSTIEKFIKSKYNKVARIMDTIKESIVADVVKSTNNQQHTLKNMHKELSTLKKQTKKHLNL